LIKSKLSICLFAVNHRKSPGTTDKSIRSRLLLNNREMTILATTLRWLLAGLFLWAGCIKLWDPKAFARSIDAFGIVPDILLAPTAILLPTAEIFIGLAVLWRLRGGLAAMAGLLLLFLAVLGHAISQQLTIDCGCFSVAEQDSHTSVRTAFIRDLFLLAGVACLGFFGSRSKLSTRGQIPAIQEGKEQE
jgi:uncharacterized membrane protein YphA (DoxX/SURF4 family)